MSDTRARLTAALHGRYRITRELGQGGMAVVFLAHDERHDRQVAVKVLKPDLAEAVGPERFLREVKIAAKLSHPHVLPLYDSGEADGFLYYVMPFVEGEALSDLLAREGALPLDQATRILCEVADALAYAHAHGVVHRDIKPDNVMLSGNHAMVADFGVARAVTAAADDQHLTATGMAIGTPTYMAPEQASGDPHVDHRADLYAFGVLAYEVLTGQPPFRATSAQGMLAAHIADTPEPISRYRQRVPEPLAALVMCCLEKLPADRVQTASELMRTLEAAPGPARGAAHADGIAPVSTAAHSESLHPIRVALIYAVVGLLTLAGVYGLVLALGLPGWVNGAAVVLLAIGLPIMLVTSHVERGPAATSGWRAWLTWRRAVMGGVAAFAGLGVVTAAYMAMRTLGIGPVGTLLATGMVSEHDQLILADFVDHTGDPALGLAVTEAFRVDLSQSPTVTLVPNSTLEGALQRMSRERPDVLTVDLAREIAEREGIPAVVSGEIHAVGGGYVLSADFVSAESGDVLVPLRETAKDSTEIIAAVDRLSRRMRERIGESFKSIRVSPPLERVTTASLPALRKYSQASKAADASEPARAIALFQEAIALDTAFAAAHRGLSIVLSNWGIDRSLAERSMAQAYRFRDRLTESERLWTAGSYFLRRRELDQALAPYLELMEREPENERVINNTGVVYTLRGEPARALEYYRRAWELDRSSSATNFNMVVSFVDLGMPDSARAAARRFRDVAPEHPMNPVHDFFVALLEEDWDAFEAGIERWAVHVDPSSASLLTRFRMSVDALRGRIAEMNRELAAESERAAQGQQVAGHLQNVIMAALVDIEVRGRAEEAAARLDRAVARFALDSLEAFDRPYTLLAEAYARAGRVERARELISAFDREVPAELKPLDVVQYERARGFMALAHGNADQAIDHFRRSDKFLCHTCVLPALARAFEAKGETDSVLTYLERFRDTPDDDRWGGNAVELARTYVRLGELYEARGEDQRAIDSYAALLDLWRDADRELQPVVAGVRRRVAGLTGEGR